MLHSHRTVPLMLSSLLTIVGMDCAKAEERLTLLGTIAKWQYPDAQIGVAEMSDAATVDGNGERTAPSSLLETTMVSDDSVDQVVEFYRRLLKRSKQNDKRLDLQPNTAASMIIRDESQGRPFSMVTIMVHAKDVSTHLIVTRGSEEKKTYITWKQYRLHSVER